MGYFTVTILLFSDCYSSVAFAKKCVLTCKESLGLGLIDSRLNLRLVYINLGLTLTFLCTELGFNSGLEYEDLRLAYYDLC